MALSSMPQATRRLAPATQQILFGDGGTTGYIVNILAAYTILTKPISAPCLLTEPNQTTLSRPDGRQGPGQLQGR